MKFLHITSFAVLALMAAGEQENARQTVQHYSGKTPVSSRDYVFMQESETFATLEKRIDGMEIAVTHPEDQEKHEDYRRLRARALRDERRHLEEGGIKVESPELSSGGVPNLITNDVLTEFVISGLDGVDSAYLIFTRQKEDLEPVDITNMITDGLATIGLQLHHEDVQYVYQLRVEYTKNGKTETVKAGTFRYGSETRRGGAVQTRSENVDGASEATDNECTTDLCKEGSYSLGGQILKASGRIFFQSYDVDYACTGTVIRDNKSGRSLVLTAAHCIFDDIDWNFGSEVVFIPERDSIDLTDMTAEDVHRECSRDICGCWSLSGGVVHDLWADTPWPERLAYDYGFYVVDDVGDHKGNSCGSDALDVSIDELDFVVGEDFAGDSVLAFGYSLIEKPDFRFCSNYTDYNQPIEDVDTNWIPGCGLRGGSSGGPWIADFDESKGTGKIVSVNSWSYSTYNGMGGPIIDPSAARCLVNAARDVDFEAMMAEEPGNQGIFVNCYSRPCIPSAEEYESRRLQGTLGGRVLCEHHQ